MARRAEPCLRKPADALAGRADLGVTASQFTGQIQSDVVRKNHRACVGNFQARGNFDSDGFQLVDFP